MIKQAPSLSRILAMLLFALSCFGILLFLWLSFGGSVPLQPHGYQLHVEFPEATQLAQEADVRISGVNVGKVTKKTADRKARLTDAVIELDHQYAPVPRDTRAILRQKTLLGETYVELTPGHRRGPKLRDGGTLPVRVRWRRPWSSTRSSAPSTPRPGRPSAPGSTSRGAP